MGVASWCLVDGVDEFAAATPEAQCSPVAQLRPLIREFTAPGGVVLDPFAGWGSTLVACHAEGRRGIGLEISADRSREARRRVAGLAGQIVLRGDALRPPVGDGAVDLVLTDLPYFGTRRFARRPIAAELGTGGTLFGLTGYDQFLAALDEAVRAMARVLRAGGHALVCVRNRNVDGRFVPLAWDVGRLMAGHLTLGDERIHIHPRPAGGDDPLVTNRAHEYLLVAVKEGTR